MKFINPRMTDANGRNLKAGMGTPVRRLRVPAWLQRRVGRQVRNGVWAPKVDVPGAEMAVFHHGDRPDWLDHWGATQHRGREVFASEPYGLTDGAIAELVNFCRSLNLKFEVDACSSHYPTATLRITMWPQEWGHPSDWARGEGTP
jgi:hypothetical protein